MFCFYERKIEYYTFDLITSHTQQSSLKSRNYLCIKNTFGSASANFTVTSLLVGPKYNGIFIFYRLYSLKWPSSKYARAHKLMSTEDETVGY